MQVTISKWGNSQGVRIPKEVMETAKISINDIVDVYVEDDKIILRKTKQEKKVSLKALFADYDGQKATPFDWGSPAGKEVW